MSDRKFDPRKLLHWLGPGLITGAADDDPSGIATYSQAGAQFGYSLAWTMLLTLPFMAGIQIISASIGWGTHRGLTRNIAQHMPQPVLFAIVVLLAIANTVNIAADLAAMGAGVKLIVGGPAVVYALVLGVACLSAEIFIPYHRYAGYLKYLTLVLFVYVAAAFSVSVPWGTVMRSTFLPDLSLDRDMLLTVVAVFGTTISPYLFFWQASQEAEESHLSFRVKHEVPHLTPRAFRHITLDTVTGMLVSNVIAFFIIVTTAATLHAHGLSHIQTAEQAAEALRPIAGVLTFALFAAGIIGTGLLAVPVLAGSAAYAVAEAFHMRGSLELPANRAIGFYAIVSAATFAGGALTLTSLDPIAILFWTAVLNGVVSVPIMTVMMLVVTRTSTLMLPGWLKVLGWLATALMAVAVGLLFWSSLSG